MVILVESEVLVTALFVSLVGISVVAASLLLLIAVTLGLRKIFAPETGSGRVEPEPTETPEVGSDVPDAALAAAAVEHHRESLELGDKLTRGSRELRRGDG